MCLGVGGYAGAACGQTMGRVGGYALESKTLPVHTYPAGERNPSRGCDSSGGVLSKICVLSRQEEYFCHGAVSTRASRPRLRAMRRVLALWRSCSPADPRTGRRTAVSQLVATAPPTAAAAAAAASTVLAAHHLRSGSSS